MHRFYLPLLLLLFPCTSVRAQIGNLVSDTLFFEAQAQTYQRWLDHSGMGQYLRYREMDVREKELAIYLEFKGDDLDLIINSWRAMKGNFEATAAITLEQQLFYKAIALMEVRPSALSVQLYDTYDLREEPLFSRSIYFDEGKVKVQESNPRSEIKPIRITPNSITGGKVLSVAELQTVYSERKVYECILSYARSFFKNAGLDGVLPEVQVLEDEENLLFKVVNLRREVLSDNIVIRLCEKIGLRDDCARREVLTFLFTYKTTADGIRIEGDIDGKYGSGVYENVPRGSYLSMEIDFDNELQEYIETMTFSVKKHLRSCQ
jgi:hypothetical protein